MKKQYWPQNTVSGLGGLGWGLEEFNRLGFGLHMSPLGRNYCRWEPSDAFPFRKRTCLPFNHMPRNVTLQRPCNVPFPAPATQSHAPTLPECFNHLPPNVTLVVRLPHNVTLQRTLPCTSHPVTRCNWKCHVYKRSNFTSTSEPISRVQANPRPVRHTLASHGSDIKSEKGCVKYFWNS